jgi:hypothetical protein
MRFKYCVSDSFHIDSSDSVSLDPLKVARVLATLEFSGFIKRQGFGKLQSYCQAQYCCVQVQTSSEAITALKMACEI